MLKQTLIILILCHFMTACQNLDNSSGSEYDRAIDGALASYESKKNQPLQLPSAIEDELFENDSLDAFNANPTETKRLNIATKNMPIREFLPSLIEGLNVSLVMHPKVSGKLSLSLKQVSLKEVLEVLEDIYGYDIQFENNLIRVFPAGLKTRTFSVNYLNIVRTSTSKTMVNASDTSSVETIDDSEPDDNNSNDHGFNGTTISSEATSHFWQELQQAVEQIIHLDQDKKVIVSPNASLLTVRAYPSELKQVEQYITSSIASLQRQVIIEAKIIEVTLNDKYEQGIDWSYFLGGDNKIPSTSGAVKLGGQGLDLSFNKIFNTDGDSFVGAITLLKTQGDLEVLSSPRLTTTNNQKAVIKVGENQPFQEGIRSNIINNNNGTITSPSTSTKIYFSGIALDITPQINAEGSVILHIHPSITDVTSKTITTEGAGENDVVFEAATTKVRESDTIIQANSGEVIIIGGLMATDQREDVTKVPLLGDIPWLGELFTSRTEIIEKKELVILLKPEVITENTWKNKLQESRELIKRWKGE